MIKFDNQTAKEIAQQIELTTGRAFQIQAIHPISGGDINAAFKLESKTENYFVKLNHPKMLTMFEAEFAGLTSLVQTNTVFVPRPIFYGNTDKVSFLLLEYLELHRTTAFSERLLGQKLAELHLQQQPYFGWHIDNTIGSTIQRNPQTKNWIEFWRKSRLDFQLQLAISNGYGKYLASLGEKLSEKLADFFDGYTPQPSLLHGDLWAGNVAAIIGNQPVMFDPACYFGDRETDLAMTELFGGFGQDFYAAYNDVWQLDSGYKTRKSLYNLYHVLNHVNLFGSSYVSQAEKIMNNLLQEIS
jgi:protein-ribulosamine 3-kinase